MKTVALVAIAGSLNACMMFMRPPQEASYYERTQTSATRLYRASFAPTESIKVGRLHSWKIQVTSRDGVPVTDAKITVDGGMPQHGHGLPTKPIVTQLAGEDYELVEGMKFNMGGWWVVKIHIDGSQGSDVVTFNLKL
ncbi:MAG: FixH family protein [Gemmatimonadaceae bacterium]